MFEQEMITYINQLISNGTIIDGNISGINEEKVCGTGIFSFLNNDTVSEKKVFFYKENNFIIWKFLMPTDVNFLDYETGNWNYSSYEKRIVAPISLIMDDIGIKMYGWFQLNGLPIVKNGMSVYLYCNEILPEHQAIVDQLGNIIVIEDRP